MDEYVLRPIGRVESLLSTGAPPRVSRWRTPKYQEQLLDEATSKYGSAEEAARWVATRNVLLTCRATRSPRRDRCKHCPTVAAWETQVSKLRDPLYRAVFYLFAKTMRAKRGQLEAETLSSARDPNSRGSAPRSPRG
jgi:hypothetical protein